MRSLTQVIVNRQFVLFSIIGNQDVLNWNALFWLNNLTFRKHPNFASDCSLTCVLIIFFLRNKSVTGVLIKFFFCWRLITFNLYLWWFSFRKGLRCFFYPFFHWNVWTVVILVNLLILFLIWNLVIFPFLFFRLSSNLWEHCPKLKMMVLVILDKELMMEMTLTICFSNLMKVIHV